MSKNYELLHKAEMDLELFRTSVLTNSNQHGGNGHSTQTDRVREEILQLVQRVFLTGIQSVPQVVVFSGIEHGNGCSWICARAGETLAALGEGRVCLVDANLNAPMLHQYFSIDSDSNLADAMLQDGPIHNFVKPVRDSNLWLMSRKALPSDVAGVTNRSRLKIRMTELRSAFEFVLVDAPPISRSLDALLLGQASDGIILVIEAHSTRRDAACKAKEKIEAMSIKLLGAILNKRTFPIPSVLYSKL